MGVLQRDPDATAATLERWLEGRRDAERPTVSKVSIPEATGWSNETIFFEAQWQTASGVEHDALVARIAPSHHRVFPDDTFVRQYAVMRALALHTDVPMPNVHWLETDPTWFGQPFWVMDRVAGDIPTDTPPYARIGWLHEASPVQQEQAWYAGIDAMSRVHRVDVDALALPVDTYPRVDDTLGWHLDHYERFLAWAEDGAPHALARRVLHELRHDRPAEPAEGPCLVWGDARLSNLVYRDFDVVAVLDWEMSGIGDPLLDLGWWIFADRALTEGAGCERLKGFPPTEQTARQWERATGRSTASLGYYELFAGLRFTVIMLRMGKLLTEMGLVPPEFAYDNLVSQALGRLFEPT
jgi:aminoglycoside phosphotransferase (APT) family kinase protein